MRLRILAIVFCFCIQLASAELEKSNGTQMVRFRPITREEYNAILKLTAGKQTISEARLISSGLAVLAGLATWTAGLWPNVLSTLGITQTTTAGVDSDSGDNYPLCVVSDNNLNTYDDGEDYEQEENKLPAVDCIIVVRKPENEESEEAEEEDYDEPEPEPMLPDYNHWPQSVYPVYPAYPYMPYAYSFPPYQAYHNYQPYPSYVYAHQQNSAPSPTFSPHSHPQSHPQPLHPPSPHPNYPHDSFYPAPYLGGGAQAPPPQQQAQGPIIHVIRGDSRNYQAEKSVHTQTRRRRPSVKRKHAKRDLKHEKNGYQRSSFPQQEYRSNYPKVSHNRAVPYEAPVYIMMP